MTDPTPECEETAGPEHKTRRVHYAVLGAVSALVIGFYALSANSGEHELEGTRGDATYYNLLVQGLRAGQLNLKREVPPGLAKLADPYDPMANEPYRWFEYHPLDDLSYYQGKLHLYFGVTPALVLFWPWYELSGRYLLSKDAVAFFFAGGFLASLSLLWAMWQRYFAQVPFAVVVAAAFAMGLVNLTPAILQHCDVYEVAISCGYALTMVALLLLWRAMHDGRRRVRWLAGASLAYGLAVGARPSLLFGAVILLVPVVWGRQKAEESRRNSSFFIPPSSFTVWLAAVGPIVLIGLGLMFYNYLRFDDPWEFGQRYQLGSDRPGALPQFSLRYLGFNFRVGFLAPTRWSARFPFVRDITLPPMPQGSQVTQPFGVLTNIPLVWLALLAPLVWRRRLKEAGTVLRGWVGAVTLVFGTCALILCLHNSMSLRYEVEYTHALVLLAVLGIFGLERALAGQPMRLRIVRWVWSLLLAFSTAFNLFASIVRHAEVENAVGIVLLGQKRTDEAIAHFQKALAIQPNEAERPNNLAWVLATCRDGSVRDGVRAVELAERANKLAGGNNPAILDTLAAAYAEAGRFGEAMRTAQAALALVKAGGQSEPVLQIQARLQLYQAGRPFHEGSRSGP